MSLPLPPFSVLIFNDQNTMDSAWVQWFTDLVNNSTTTKPLLTSKTMASSSAAEFTSLINKTYKRYIIEGENLRPSSLDSFLRIFVSTDAGITYKTGSADYDWFYSSRKANESSGSVELSEAFTYITSSLNLMPANISNDSNSRLSIRIEIQEPGSTTVHKLITWTIDYIDSSGYLTQVRGTGVIRITDAINGIKLEPSAGVFTSGQVKLYGVK